MSGSVRPVFQTPDDQEFQAWKAAQSRTPQVATPQAAPLTHDDAEFQSWKSNRAGGGIEDNSRSGILGTIQHSADAVVSGTPFMQKAVAGVRGAGRYAWDRLQGVDSDIAMADAKTQQRDDMANAQAHVAALPTATRIPLQMLGASPLAAAVAPLGILGGGAAFGAIAGADRDTRADPTSEDGALERVKNIAKGAAGGVIGAKAGQLGGRILGNIATRSGLTDFVSKGLSTVAPNEAAAIGTAGQVGEALSDRQSIIDNLGDAGDVGQTAAKQQIDRVADIRTQAKQLYDAARDDQTVINNPRIRQILADPRVQKAYRAVTNSFDQSGKALPNAPTGTLSARSSGGDLLSSDEVSNAAALFDRLHGNGGSGVNPTLPDPETLSLLKRELYASAQGKIGSSIPLKQEEAQQILPLVEELRGQLHDASPAWKTADAYYSMAKGEEGAFSNGYDSPSNAKNLSGNTLTTNSPEAQRLALENPRFPSEPADAQAARGTAFRTGASSAHRDAIMAKPVDRGLQSITGLSELAPTEQAAQARSLMFQNQADASPLEQTLAKIRGKAAAMPSSNGGNRIPLSPTGLLRAGIRKATQTPDLIEREGGQQLLTTLRNDPAALAQQIGQYRAGDARLAAIRQLLGTLVGAQAAR